MLLSLLCLFYIMVYRIPLHRTGKAIQFLLQAVLLHYIAKIHANSHWDLNSLTLNIEPEHVFQYCTGNVAAGRRHIQSYYKSIAFYCAYVYRIEKYRIAARIFNTYRIVRHAYRYTPNVTAHRYAGNMKKKGWPMVGLPGRQRHRPFRGLLL